MKIYKALNQNLLFPSIIKDFYSEGVKKELADKIILIWKEPISIELPYESSSQPVLSHDFKGYNPFYVFAFSMINILSSANVQKLLNISTQILDHMNLEESSFITYNLYGTRIEKQLDRIIKILNNKKQFQDAILHVRKPEDLGISSYMPLPTLTIQFLIQNDYVNMYVSDACNDILRDYFSYQAAYLGYLHNLVGFRLNLPLGSITHNIMYPYTYLSKLKTVKINDYLERSYPIDATTPLITKDYYNFKRELDIFWFEGVIMNSTESFLRKVVQPIINAWTQYRNHQEPQKYTVAIHELEKCQSIDWKLRCQSWLQDKFDTWKKAYE